jgi:hypothetical protein
MQTSHRLRLKRHVARASLSPAVARTRLGRFLLAGGVEAVEHAAAEAAITAVWREWLPAVERMRREWRGDRLVAALLRDEVNRLRRRLRRRPPRDAVRTQTRERVRRWRARQRLAISLK